MYDKIKELFLQDVKDHELTIIINDGVNRHLRFSRKDNTTYYFDIITFAGNLLITGDMGSYLFARTNDMFEFFVHPSNPSDDPLYINPYYWGQKLQAIDRNGYNEFDGELFEQRVKQTFEEWKEGHTELSEEVLQDIWEHIEQEVIDHADSEHQAFMLTDEFSYYHWKEEKTYDDIFVGTWEWELKQCTHHYIWNCYAIVWGIRKYNENAKEKI
jgi:hypothetical protein